MRVSKLPVFLIFIIACGLGLILGPVTAGEHPWAEDPLLPDSDTTGTSFDTLNEDDDNGSDFGSYCLGTTLFWFELVYDTATGEGLSDSSSGLEEISDGR